MHPYRTAPLGALLLVAALAGPALASWPYDPNVGGVPVCSAAGDQDGVVVTSDGAGGTFVAWVDLRGAAKDVYAQRLDAAGVPLWTANGVPVCTASGDQDKLRLVPDGAGGALLAWQDYRAVSTVDIYAQRLGPDGAALWTANGVPVCTTPASQFNPSLVADGSGGAIVAWEDYRAGNSDVYGQRVSAGGATQWTANGIALCGAANSQIEISMIPDGVGGAIAAWTDARSAGTGLDIYIQRVNGSGVVLLSTNGAVVCGIAGDQSVPGIIPDGLGGSLVCWQDVRSGNIDVYAQRFSAANAPLWLANGQAVCTAANAQLGPRAVSDGAGGAILVWQDQRSGTGVELYTQRMGAGGAPQWTANGVPIAGLASAAYFPAIASDGAGGAIVVWEDYRAGTDLYAQRVYAAGYTAWTPDGVALSTAASYQFEPALVSDGAGGVFAAWQDFRNGAPDVYAQRLDRFGRLGDAAPVITSVTDVPNDQGGHVKLAWSASYLDAEPRFGVLDYRAWRSVPSQALFAGGLALRRGFSDDPDEAAATGRIWTGPFAAQGYAWELVGSQPAGPLSDYSMVVATTADSVGGSNPLTAFLVQARSADWLGAPYWYSSPDSGYSVDDLAPAAPAPFTGTYGGGATHLAWSPNREGDLAGYRLYRGSTTGFVPGPGNLVSAQPDTGYVDAAGAPYVYKLTAVDVHGNESTVATLVPSGTTGADGPAMPSELAFAAPHPNPARGATTLRYALTREGRVRIAMYDAGGRQVRVLREGAATAGDHAETFDLVDGGGRALAPGLYLLRFEAEGRAFTRRIVAIR